jgi:hypothetical protein
VADYKFKREIKIDSSRGDGNVETKCPVLIDREQLKTPDDEIAFFSDENLTIPLEVHPWPHNSDMLGVIIPVLSSTEDTVIYVGYNKSKERIDDLEYLPYRISADYLT